MAKYPKENDKSVVKMTCAVCGKEEVVLTSYASRHRTCSHKCGAVLANRGRGFSQAEEHSCNWCGKTVKRYPSQICESGLVYCSWKHWNNKRKGKAYRGKK